MKRKYFFVIFFLVLAIFLSGCSGGGIVTPATDEAKVKNVINEYFLAISDKNWSKAKSCCVYGSVRYYKTCDFEEAINTQFTSNVTITCYVTISNVSVNGNYASAYFDVTTNITDGSYYNSDSLSRNYNLQKVGESWKITGP